MTDFTQAPQFDTGPLSWVMGEIREALGRSNTALTEASERAGDAQASSLKHAKAYLHQAHGALQMVDVDGAGVMTEAAEQALDRFQEGALDCTRERAAVIGAAYQAVIEYLEELMSGAPQQPARLFPYYRALKEMLNAPRIHPADLFFADLSAPAALRRHEPANAPDFAACRGRFEKALLPFLKSTDAAAQRSSAEALQAAIASVADAQGEPLARTFWLAMQGFAELVTTGQLASDLYVKQLFGLINLQLRRLSQGQGSLPEQMLRDALFFIAAAPNPPPAAQALRRAYHLDGVVPHDYDTRRYGRIDPEALKTAKDALAKAQHAWDRLSGERNAAQEAEFETLLTVLAAASEKLDSPALARLLHELERATALSAKNGRSSEFSLEMATAMLFIEHGLDKIRQLPDDFDAHAEVVGSRMLALAAGDVLPAAPQWQGDLSRQIQQEQTVGVLAAEMRNSLRQVEKVLDDYYADSSKRASLTQIDPLLHQLQGAVAILDQDEAMRAAQHVKEAVRTLASAEGNPELEAASLQNIAQNIGALGFFVDMLAQNFDAAKERFAFDSEQGMLRAVTPEKTVQGESQFDQEPVPHADAEGTPIPAPAEAETEAVKAEVAKPADIAVLAAAPAPVGEEAIEAELLEIFIMEAQEVLALVTETLPAAHREPSNVDQLTVLRRAFHTLKGSGRMVGLNNFGEGAAAVEKCMNLWLSEGRAASPDLLAMLDYAAGEMTAWVDELAANFTSARNSAVLVAAATRVQDGAAFSIDAVEEAAPAAEEIVAALPVEEEAEAAAAEEVVALDAPLALEDTLAVEETVQLEALPELTIEAAALPDDGLSFDTELTFDPEPVIEAEAVAEPALEPEMMLEPEMRLEPEMTLEPEVTFEPEMTLEPELTLEPETTIVPELTLDAAPVEEAPVEAVEGVEAEEATVAEAPVEAELTLDPEPVAEVEAPLVEETLSFDEPEPVHMAAAPMGGNVIEFPGTNRAAAQDDNTKRIGELEIPLPLYNIYLAETDELMRVLTQDFSAWRGEPQRGVTAAAMKAAHTLAGTSATVGFNALREIAFELEMVLKSPAPVLDESQRGLLDETLVCASQMLQSFAQGDLAQAQPDLVARLEELRDQLAAQERAKVYAGADQDLANRLDTLFVETHESFAAAPAAASDAEEPFETIEIEALAEPSVDENDTIVLETEPVAELEEAAEPVVLADPEPMPEPALQAELAPEAEDEPVVLAAPEAEPELLAEPEPEPVLLDLSDAEQEPTVQEVEPEPEPQPEPEPAPAPVVVAVPKFEPAPAVLAGLDPLPAVEPDQPAPAIPTAFSDDLDADLLPVFLEEATDLLPEIGNSLRKWQQNPSDATPAQQILRTLHTVKGSARMAGAMRLGQHTHDIETQIENMVHAGTSTPAAFDDLMANYDHALLLFEQLQMPAEVAAPAPGAPAAEKAATVDDAHAAQSKSPLVRVRADILDRLVNQAGEVSITRSKLESQISTLKASLSDFADNLGRLRRQLREVEMQAESQISSRMSISSEREFDPLEFDRFTRLQELTRMMAESVNDVSSFHESLARTVDGATDDLTTQSRLTRDLQQDLMRVRMVPFSSLSERLFRVARQTAKEIDKRVNLDIRGGSVEIDRSVLEQMAAPFEHLLRNSIVHGIETRAKRGVNGKPETGELLVQVSQQGNEVVIQFNDDGAGLDLNRIRAKARENGLLAAGQEVSDAEAAALIFEPGFSTADSLTELAGRGVGMDVVRSQAQALGGRVAIASEAGKGARFTIHLPLTLSVTQVVLTTSGTKTYAVPSILVEQVLQIKEAPLEAAMAAGYVEFQGQKIALHYLPNLLGDMDARPMVQRSGPVMVLRNGTDRLAVRVDDVQGNREVVIKNIGPQLSRMIGIAGATVLGSGEIVLILNPVALSTHLDHHPDLRPRATVALAAVQAAPETRAADYVIMVVDDSLTVRKVTQRLLEREGYQVMLAKDGVDALEHLQETIPDLMLVDIEMPRMDGFDLTRNIRGNDSTSQVPIIMITSRTADKHRNYALDLGVNAYFGKPFQEDMLLAAISGLLKREMPVTA